MSFGILSRFQRTKWPLAILGVLLLASQSQSADVDVLLDLAGCVGALSCPQTALVGVLRRADHG